MAPRIQHCEASLRVQRLGVTYPGGIRALDDASFDVNGAEFVVIIGRSGAGKSTLLRSINRLVRPTQGEIYFNGSDVTAVGGGSLRRYRAEIGMVFQHFNLVRRLSVLQNVCIGRSRFQRGFRRIGSVVRVFSKADQQAAFEALRSVGIERQAFQRADTLSGGQQQRVAIARALAQEPSLLLADEPIASLDPRSSRTVMEILQEINVTRSIPVIVNLHQVDYAREFGRRIIGMSAGRIVFDGPGQDLDDASVRRVYGSSQVPADATEEAARPIVTVNPPRRAEALETP